MSQTTGNKRKHNFSKNKPKQYTKRRFGQSKEQELFSRGVKGILVSCPPGKEHKCAAEVALLLNEYAEKFYPTLDEGKKKEADKPEKSLELEIEEELSALKQPYHTKRFFWLGTNCKSSLFFVINQEEINPVTFVCKIFEDLKQSQQQKTRFTSRMTPIELTSHANNLTKTAQTVIPPYFPNDFPISLRVDYNCKNNSNFSRSRDKVLKLLTQIANLNVHVVDLKLPKKTIICEIFQKYCGISVVEDIHKYNNFKIRSCVPVPQTVREEPIVNEVTNNSSNAVEQELSPKKPEIELQQKTTDDSQQIIEPETTKEKKSKDTI